MSLPRTNEHPAISPALKAWLSRFAWSLAAVVALALAARAMGLGT